MNPTGFAAAARSGNVEENRQEEEDEHISTSLSFSLKAGLYLHPTAMEDRQALFALFGDAVVIVMMMVVVVVVVVGEV